MGDTATSPTILWLRRDLRLADHPTLRGACKRAAPVIPVFIHDDLNENLGAAPKWRLGLGLECLGETLAQKGSRLVLRRGKALDVLRALIAETGAGAVYWSRLYDPDSVRRDSDIKAALKQDGLDARSFGGHLMFEPWTVQTQAGGYYKVYTPFWNAVKGRDVDAPLSEPSAIPAPENWPQGDDLGDWSMGAAMVRGGDVLRPHARPGEGAALDRLDHFIDEIVAGYDDSRDCPGIDGTSNLSDHLALGEISPHRCWHAALRARHDGKRGAETWQKELVWREFAYHLMHHTPRILDANWKPEWAAFPWSIDGNAPHVLAWKQGRTGVPFVDAAMREMYVTGRMHNRGRMIVASYLTKHLMTHWRIGQAWFDECLTDWDPASNAMGWQWAAGSGPDASPYFRVFNPETQAKTFDPDGTYRRRWIAEGQSDPPETALDYFRAIPRHWDMHPDDGYPEPVVGMAEGRAAALAAYQDRKTEGR